MIALAGAAGPAGAAMGALVDALVERGHRAEAVEQAIWRLLGERRLTPSGFVCRTMQRRQGAATTTGRAYELLLAPWSPEQDQQLELLSSE